MSVTESQAPLRVGLVGLGFFGRIHLDAWASVRGAEVVGVCDRDDAAFDTTAVTAQESFHVDAGDGARVVLPAGATRHASIESLLASGVDLIDVVVTEDQHEDCVRAGLEAGVNVMVEKPLALTLDGATELTELARLRGQHIYPSQVLRFDPRYASLANALTGQRLRHISLKRTFQTSAHDVYGRAHPILNAAVHDIDLAVWWAGTAPDRVTAFGSHFLGRDHPDCLDLVLEWSTGLRALIHNSWHLPASCPYGFVFDCTVQADGGTYLVRNEPVLQAWEASGATAPELFFWPRYADARQGALVAELDHFADCTRRGVASERVPLTEILDVMSTCEAAIDALDSGAMTVPRRATRLLASPEPARD